MKLAIGALALAAACAANAQGGAAEAVPVADAVRAAVLAAVPTADGTVVQPLVDDRLRLAACTGALVAAPVRSGTYEVACAAPAWKLYVPVRLQRSVPVLVLLRMVAAGEPIDASAVAVERRDVGALAAPGPTDAAALDGMVARRVLAPGTVLTARDIARPPAVRRGDAVALVSRAGGIEVRAAGKALGDAGLGQRVNVENLGSRRIVQARATGPGEVEATR